MSGKKRFPFEKVGLWATLAYLAILFLMVVVNWGSFSALKPNEWGDFLAGTLGPVALVWVVLSFFLQGRELQHSVEALKLQAEELKNSVDQQKAMVGITEKQLQLDIEVREEQTKQSVANELPLIRMECKGSAGTHVGYTTYKFRCKT